MRRDAKATVKDPKEDRTRRIVETAISLAERDGYDAVRLRDVAAQANVALGTVYRRFTSKEDILVAALEHEIASVQEPLAAATRSGSAVDRVNAVFRVLTEHLLEREHLARALLRAVASGVPDVAEKVTRFHSLVIDLIASIADAEPIAGPEHETTRRELSQMVQNIWFAELVGWASGLHSKDEILEQMDRSINVILRGLLAEQGAS